HRPARWAVSFTASIAGRHRRAGAIRLKLLRPIADLGRRTLLLYRSRRASRLNWWSEHPLLDHDCGSGEVMPTLLTRVSQLHDQHDQQTNAGDKQGPEHQRTDDNSSQDDRTPDQQS